MIDESWSIATWQHYRVIVHDPGTATNAEGVTGEMNTPVHILTTLWSLNSRAAWNDTEINHLDIITGILNSEVKDDTQSIHLQEGRLEHGPNDGTDEVTDVQLRIAHYVGKTATSLLST